MEDNLSAIDKHINAVEHHVDATKEHLTATARHLSALDNHIMFMLDSPAAMNSNITTINNVSDVMERFTTTMRSQEAIASIAAKIAITVSNRAETELGRNDTRDVELGELQQSSVAEHLDRERCRACWLPSWFPGPHWNDILLLAVACYTFVGISMITKGILEEDAYLIPMGIICGLCTALINLANYAVLNRCCIHRQGLFATE